MLEVNRDPSSGQLRLFAGLWLLFCVAAGAMLYRKMNLPVPAVAIWACGGPIGVVGLLHPSFAKPLFVGSMYLTFPIGWVVAHLLMAVVYYGVLTPIGLLMRFARPDPLARQFDKTKESYWEPHREAGAGKRYFQQH